MKNGTWKIAFLAAGLAVLLSGCRSPGLFKAAAGSDGAQGTNALQETRGIGEGYNGRISVTVYRRGETILAIEVTESAEDAFTGSPAIEELRELVIEANSTDVDVISGATESSRGFLNAVEDALR